MTTTAAANVDLLRGLYQLLTDGGIDQAAEHLTEDFVANQPGRPEPTIGRDPWKQGTQYMLAAFPDLKVTFRSLELYRIKDGKVAEEWVAPDAMDLVRQLTA